jgi:hypothetical protein
VPLAVADILTLTTSRLWTLIASRLCGENDMAELKTKKTNESVTGFLNEISDEQRREDCFAVAKIMEEVTKASPKMWGASIVGFGSYHYEYGSGRVADWPVTGFSPRKQNLTLYIMAGFDKHPDLMAKLGPHSTGKSCLYVKRLSDIHIPTLKKLIKESIKYMKTQFPVTME